MLARSWRAFEAGCAKDASGADAGSYLRLRYEDLASRPETELRAVCGFLGEEFCQAIPTASERTTAVPASGVPWQAEAAGSVRAPEGRWRDRLTLRDRALVTSEVHDVLAGAGYPPADPRLLTLGRLLGPTRRPALRAERRRNRVAATARTPEERHAAVQEFMTRRMRLLAQPEQRR